MCTIGIFIISNIVSTLLGYRKSSGPPIWRKFVAVLRYSTYRGFYIKALKWNSAPIGVLLLGLAGTIFFFCKLRLGSAKPCWKWRADTKLGMDLAPKPYYWVDEMFGGSPPLATRSGWMALACMPFVLYVVESHIFDETTDNIQRNCDESELDHTCHWNLGPAYF